MKKILLVFALLFLYVSFATTASADRPDKKKGNASTGYRIIFTPTGSSDTVLYLGNYYAGNTYVSDTARPDRKGRFIFERDNRTLLPGMYFFCNDAGKHVDFVIYHETPRFSLTAQTPIWSTSMKVQGSKENAIMFDYQRQNAKLYAVIDSAKTVKTDEKAFEDFRHQIMQQLDSIKLQIIAKNPDCFLSLIMNATREPVAPPTTDSAGAPLSDRQRWEFYMDHYFDNMSLNNDAMVRTPDAIFHKPLTNYLDRNLKGASPEIICHYVDRAIEKARPSKEMYKYLVHMITEKYLQSSVMGYDAIYVHMVKKYYASGDNYWSSPSVIDEQVKRANTWDRLLIGKKAPELILKDDHGAAYSLHQLPSRYTLLIFWSPTCGHCKTMIPEIYNIFLKYKDSCNITAFTILSEPDDPTRAQWRTFIEKHHLTDPAWLNLDGGEANIDWHEVYDIITTPQIYLLDRNKEIVAKKLNAETFEIILKALENKQ